MWEDNATFRWAFHLNHVEIHWVLTATQTAATGARLTGEERSTLVIDEHLRLRRRPVK